ncbi:hypothetical protein ABPG74_017639 [Tetrahymena malaccensis]
MTSKAVIQSSLQILQQLEKELEKSKTSIQSQSSMSQLSSSSPLQRNQQQSFRKEHTKQSEAINIINEIDLIQNKQFKQASHHNSSTIKISPLKRKLFTEDTFQQKCNFLEKNMQQENKQFSQDIEFLQRDLEQTRQRLQQLLQNQQIYQ